MPLSEIKFWEYVVTAAINLAEYQQAFEWLLKFSSKYTVEELRAISHNIQHLCIEKPDVYTSEWLNIVDHIEEQLMDEILRRESQALAQFDIESVCIE